MLSTLQTDTRIKTSSGKLKFLARGSIASHTDYETGGSERVTNSRFSERDFKIGLGYQLSKFKTDLRYNYNNSDLGIPEEIGDQITTRTPDSPFQEITSHIVKAHIEELVENFQGYPELVLEYDIEELLKYHLNNAVWDFDKGLVLKLAEDKLITHAVYGF